MKRILFAFLCVMVLGSFLVRAFAYDDAKNEYLLYDLKTRSYSKVSIYTLGYRGNKYFFAFVSSDDFPCAVIKVKSAHKEQVSVSPIKTRTLVCGEAVSFGRYYKLFMEGAPINPENMSADYVWYEIEPDTFYKMMKILNKNVPKMVCTFRNKCVRV